MEEMILGERVFLWERKKTYYQETKMVYHMFFVVQGVSSLMKEKILGEG